jgi:hypothetical protein
MTNRIADISLRKAARVAGFAFLISIIVGFVAFERFDVPGDAATTADNIMASEMLFRIKIASTLIVLTLDVVVAWALYVLLTPVNKSLSLLMAWFRMMYATIYGIAQLNLFFVLQLLSGADYLTVFETDQLHALVLLFLNPHNPGFLIGLVFFGFHVFALGYLVFKSGYIPRILGVLLIFVSLGYLVNSFAYFLLPNYSNYEAIFYIVTFLPAFIAELSLSLWLLLKGAKIPEMKS